MVQGKDEGAIAVKIDEWKEEDKRMTKIVAPAKDLLEGLRLFALPLGSKHLFSPLVLEARNGKVLNTVSTKSKGAFSRGIIEGWKIERDTPEGKQIVIETEEIFSALQNFPSGAIVTIEVMENGTITLTSELKKCTLIPKEVQPSIPKILPSFDETGKAWYISKEGAERLSKGKKTPVEPDSVTTGAVVKAEALAQFTGDADNVGLEKFALSFVPGSEANGGYIRGDIGSLDSKKRVWETKVPAAITGEEAGVVVSKDFRHIVSNLKGNIELQLSDGKPLIVVYKGDKQRVFYVLSPLKET